MRFSAHHCVCMCHTWVWHSHQRRTTAAAAANRLVFNAYTAASGRRGELCAGSGPPSHPRAHTHTHAHVLCYILTLRGCTYTQYLWMRALECVHKDRNQLLVRVWRCKLHRQSDSTIWPNWLYRITYLPAPHASARSLVCVLIYFINNFASKVACRSFTLTPEIGFVLNERGGGKFFGGRLDAFSLSLWIKAKYLVLFIKSFLIEMRDDDDEGEPSRPP